MKIKALIEKLQSYPADMEVLVDGYEGGYDDISKFREMKVKKQDAEDYYGEFEDADLVKNDSPAFAAVVLARKGM